MLFKSKAILSWSASCKQKSVYFDIMKNSQIFSIVLSLIVSLSSHAQTTTLDFTIGAAFFDIGTYSVSKKIEGDSTFYVAVSVVSLSYLFSKYQVQFTSKSKFYKDTLMTCHVDVFVNDELRESNHTQYINSNYQIHRVDEEKNVRDELLNTPAIFITSSMLFFIEPEDPIRYSQNYAELYGIFNKMEKSGKNQYDITNKTTGRKTTYNYKKGLVVSSIVDYPIMTFRLKRN